MRLAAALLIAATSLGCRREGQDPPPQQPQPYGSPYGQNRPYGSPGGQPYGTPYGQPAPQQPAAQPAANPMAVMVGQAWGMLGALAQVAVPPRPVPGPAGSPQPLPPAPTGQPPAGTPAVAGWEKFESDVLTLTNQRRAAGASCGGRAYPPAPPLAAHPQLHAAARGHAVDMGTRGYFDHTTPEGRSPSDRARAAGYPRGVGENIAVGQRSPEEVVNDWMTSAGHCSNIMDSSYTQIGVGYARVGNDQWVQVFGS